MPRILIPLILLSMLATPLVAHGKSIPCAKDPAHPQQVVVDGQEVSERVCIDNPLAGGTTPDKKPQPVPIPKILGRLINFILSIIGGFALFFFILGGFTFLTSGGNPDKIKKGKSTLIWAILGLFVSFGSYLLLNTILKTLTTQ